MVDVDGVLIRHPAAQGWTVNLERDLGVSPATLQEVFFKPHWDDVVHGRAALRDRLAPVLREIAPTVSCDHVIRYWFSNDAHLDRQLLGALGTLRHAGVEVHLATVQEHERANFLWKRMKLENNFDGMHYAAALGYSKPDVGFYRSVEEATGLLPNQIFFIDDREPNVIAAQECGWTAAVWTGQETLANLIADQRWNVP